MNITINDVEAIIFDFDGVLTDNKVFVDQHGLEWVCCNRSDGLGFDTIRKLKIKAYIVSTEKNKVVTARAAKLKIPVLQGVENKETTIKRLAENEKINLKKVLYVGNDLNDLNAMQLCGISACPADSHKKVKEISTYVLQENGGCGVVREILEEIFKIDLHSVLYST